MSESSLISTKSRPVRARHKPSPQDEWALVQQARHDPLAFGELFDLHHDRIFNYLVRRTANIHLAKELTSNTFYKALKSLHQFKGGVPLSAWLYRIATNEVNKHYRNRKTNELTSFENYAEIIEDPGSQSDGRVLQVERQLAENKLFLEMHGAVASLKPKYQEVIALKYFENKKIREISEITGKSVGTVKSLLHRAYKQLRVKLETTYFDEVG